ncbi:Phage tail fiber protein [Chromobacterium vaccinii]|nr:Phage tail fiber protein [Chromobacterium vaccinii]QND89010.1 Phage tail fiber protein [Chromobacterium vaccinii]
MVDIANPKTPGFPNVYQIEKTDKVQGGAGGVANRQAEQLVERTAFLKKQIDDIVSGALVAEYADRLKTARTIAITGDGSWAVTFDGNGNVSGALTLANTGVAAGSYGLVTVDAKGRVTSGIKPTTLDGYGITDAQPASPDLTALASLKGAPGLYVNTGPGSAVVRTLAAGQGVTVSNGDGRAGNPTVALGNSGVVAGSYGVVTVDAMGRVTAGRQMGAADVPAHDWSKIATGKPTTLDGYGITDGQPASPDLTALASLKGAPGLYVNTGPGSAVVRTLAAGQGVTISNGDGKAGNPTVALGNSGVAAGSYGIVTVDTMGRVTAGRQMTAGDVPALDWSKIAGGKPTTLAGYGIADGATSAQLAAAMQYALGISVDPVGDLNSISISGSAVYNSKTANRPSPYGVVITVSNLIGIPAGGTDQSCWVFQQAFGTDGTISQRRRVNAGDWSPWVLLSDAGPSGVAAGTYGVVTVDDRGRVTAGRQMTAADLPALDWSKITNKPATLAGYGIAAATQGEAEAGAENTKPMTALRVFQAIAKKVGQATEALTGFARIATQDETNVGDDDTAIVTPRKLRGGFSCSLTENGYIAFPWWLAGPVLQWGRILAIPYDGSKRMPLPMPLPTLPFCSFAVIEAASVSPNGNYSVYAQHDAAGVTVYLDGNVTSGSIPQNAFVFSIGKR